MDFNFSEDENKFTNSKKDVLKFLKIIGIDTRYISYTPSKIYINNLRFSKFSKTKEKIFKKNFPSIEVLRSSLFQKICMRSSRVLSNKLNPKDIILIPKNDNSINELLTIVLEPYTRKYGIKLVYGGKYDLKAYPLFLDDEVNHVFSEIFKGNGIDFNNDKKAIYPFINIPKEWLNSFLEMENFEKVKENNINKTAESFMEFLSEIIFQYRENVLLSKEYIFENLKTNK